MRADEAIFFVYCYILRTYFDVDVRDVVNMFYHEGMMHRKQCWYLLKKWISKGNIYDYGITLDLGWFEDPFFMPERYKTLIRDYLERRKPEDIKEHFDMVFKEVKDEKED